MRIGNMLSQIMEYGRELNTTWAPIAERSSEREQSPSADLQDSVEISGEILREQDSAASGDSTGARIDAIANLQAVSPGDRHSDSLMANRNGTLSLLQGFDAPLPQAGQGNINFAARYGVPAASPAGHEAAHVEAGKRPDITAHPEVRKTFDTYLSEHQKDLPRLTPEKYEALGATDGKDGRPVFNCIANSVRNEQEIIEPKVFVDKFDEFYGEHGFKPLDTPDYSLQEGVEKVVLYGFTPSDGKNYDIRREAWGPDYENYQGPLSYHAVVQDKDGLFSSKMGSHERIRVADPEDLGGGLYGNPVRVYARPRQS